MTKDSVAVEVDAVIFYKVVNPADAVLNVEDCPRATFLLSMTMLRNSIGQNLLYALLGDLAGLSNQLEEDLQKAMKNWGVNVERVEM